MELRDYLKLLATKDGSDLYLIPTAPPSAKFQGKLTPIEKATLTSMRVKEIAYELMNEEQIKEFEHSPEMNLAISEPGIGRFRVNIYKQRNHPALVIRNIKTEIPNADDLHDFTENRAIYLRILTRFHLLLMIHFIASALDEWAMLVRTDGVESLRRFHNK